jgi:cytochrome c-type biogenesis protein CcmH/NrfG
LRFARCQKEHEIDYDCARNRRVPFLTTRRSRNQLTTDNARSATIQRAKRNNPTHKVQKETIIFTTCGFLLGLTLGGLVIGPKVAQSRLTGNPAASADGGAAMTAASQATPPAGGNPMVAVQQQLATLKDAIAKDPRNFEALVQLGDMYMDAAKFPQAIDYLERAVAVRDDANVHTDLGICYKQAGQPGAALAEFEHAVALAPDQWQPLFNQAIVLNELHRTDEARTVAAKLEKMKPGDPDVQKLLASLVGKQ